jgi:hypothetical protein
MTTTTIEARVHAAHEVCRNTDRSINLGYRFDADDLAMGIIDRPGSDFCGECSAAFDDSEHGAAARCRRKGRHVCTIWTPLSDDTHDALFAIGGADEPEDDRTPRCQHCDKPVVCAPGRRSSRG